MQRQAPWAAVSIPEQILLSFTVKYSRGNSAISDIKLMQHWCKKREKEKKIKSTK